MQHHSINKVEHRLHGKFPKCIIVMVGLPARGKTFIARRLARYFDWIGLRTKVFNVGNYRRKMFPNNSESSFFDTNNVEGRSRRLKCALQALSDLSNWLEKGGDVAIFDATNTTRERRGLIIQKCVTNQNREILFVESICDDDQVINNNVQSVKLSSPDYENVPEDKANKDFNERINNYRDHDVGRRFVVNKISGVVAGRAVYFLMNTHIMPRSIYISRTAETIRHQQNQFGSDSTLSERGKEYVSKMTSYILDQNIQDLVVWASEDNSAQETVKELEKAKIPVETWRALNELNAGLCSSLSYKEIATKYGNELALRDNDKFHFRYPMGESYEDLVYRLEPVIMELERAENIVVVARLAVVRCILGYFLNLSSEEIPYINVHLHTLIKLTPNTYGCQQEDLTFDVDIIDTYRAKPRNCSPSRTLAEALETTPNLLSEKDFDRSSKTEENELDHVNNTNTIDIMDF
ncbi:hypothetical protein GJ496_006980 [Pomphorhynchus laevis]|nr:hypothetical protein GJ496_006980 [Pomphorhynchus laevis]